MPRPPRRDAETGIHHVMNRGVDHQAIFFSDGDRLAFGEGLAVAHEEHDVTTLAYCLMGNHFHLLLRSPPGALSAAMHQLTSTYSHHVNQRIGRDGPLFRGRFHSIPVETDSYLVWAARYIHRNALDLPGVHRLEDHRWSSYRAYIGLRPAAPFLDLRPVLDLVGGTAALASMTEDVRFDPAIDDLRRLVDCAIAVGDLAHPVAGHERSHMARTLLVLLEARSSDPHLLSQVSAVLGRRTPRAVRSAARRAEVRLRTDEAIGRALGWIEAALAAPSTPRRSRPERDRSVPGTDRSARVGAAAV